MLELGPIALVERLREVLKRKYRETCPNCDRLFSLSDLSHDLLDGENYYRVTCQDCGVNFVEIITDTEYGDEVSGFVAALDENADRQ